ncbi:MAG: hypothetical protein DVB25_05915 [Verrucomicrobia bacterium]|nr:MAG: hypothetical protein DVB25_05915 [Verrucomicrobiota bacterium]
MKKYTLTLLLTAAPLFAGTQAPVVAPQANTEQGWTLGVEPMAMAPYASDSWTKNDYTFAGRGSLGYQFSDGLFVTATYFGYGGDLINHTNITPADGSAGYLEQYSGRMSATYIDLVLGQNFKPTDTLKLSPFVGLRWATGQQGYTDTLTSPYPVVVGTTTVPIQAYREDFQGLGIVVGIDATRALGNDFSLYGTAKESVIFGTSKSAGAGLNNDYSDSSDSVVSISELGLGVQYDFCFSGVASNIRLGVEGQWWALPNSNIGNGNFGLAGFVLGANFRF